MDWFDKLLHQLQWAIPGLVGAAVATFAVPSQRQELSGKRDILLFLLSGGAIAHYMTVPVCVYFHLDPGSVGGIGFLLGAFGGAVFTAIMKAIKAADLWALLKSRFGGGAQ